MSQWLVGLGIFLAMAVPVRAQVATESAAVTVEQRSDLTETKGEVVGQLEQLLRENPVGPLRWNNGLAHVIRRAVDRGVAATTLVLILAFPMVAAVIAASRHLIGLRGFGIFIPAVLAVAFVASGMGPGILLFGVILLTATVGRMALKRLRLQYLPRMALLLWLVSLGVLGVMTTAAEIGLGNVAAVGIFPVLILILLAENFSEVQATKSMRTAINLTVETMVLALIAAGGVGLPPVQRWVLLNPELAVVTVAVFDVFVGKYVGLRWSEYARFKGLAEK